MENYSKHITSWKKKDDLSKSLKWVFLIQTEQKS